MEYLVRAARKLGETDPETQVLIVGHGKEWDDTKALAAEYGPYGVPQTGAPVACRQLSASVPASTALSPMESRNSATALLAGAESPAIGR